MQNEINEFYQALHVLAKKVNKKEYELVAGVMFQLYMGEKFGYLESLDGRFLTDIRLIYGLNKSKHVSKKAKILKLKIIQGGKSDQ